MNPATPDYTSRWGMDSLPLSRIHIPAERGQSRMPLIGCGAKKQKKKAAHTIITRRNNIKANSVQLQCRQENSVNGFQRMNERPINGPHLPFISAKSRPEERERAQIWRD